MEAFAVKEKNNLVEKWDYIIKHKVAEAENEFNNPMNIPSDRIANGEEINGEMKKMRNDQH